MLKLENLQVSLSEQRGFKTENRLQKNKHATDLRGLCLMNDNAGAHTYKLVQDFLERETVVQLHNPPYSPDFS